MLAVPRRAMSVRSVDEIRMEFQEIRASVVACDIAHVSSMYASMMLSLNKPPRVIVECASHSIPLKSRNDKYVANHEKHHFFKSYVLHSSSAHLASAGLR